MFFHACIASALCLSCLLSSTLAGDRPPAKKIRHQGPAESSTESKALSAPLKCTPLASLQAQYRFPKVAKNPAKPARAFYEACMKWLKSSPHGLDRSQQHRFNQCVYKTKEGKHGVGALLSYGVLLRTGGNHANTKKQVFERFRDQCLAPLWSSYVNVIKLHESLDILDNADVAMATMLHRLKQSAINFPDSCQQLDAKNLGSSSGAPTGESSDKGSS